MNILTLLLFKNSRKVGFGVWLFIVCNVWLVMKLINADQWMLTIALCSGLIGGGTVADTWLSKKRLLDTRPTETPK